MFSKVRETAYQQFLPPSVLNFLAEVQLLRLCTDRWTKTNLAYKQKIEVGISKQSPGSDFLSTDLTPATDKPRIGRH